MADAAETDGKASGAASVPPFPMKLLLIVSVVALVFGVGGAIVAVKFFGGSDKAAEHADEHKTETAAKADAHADASGKPGQPAALGVMFDLDPFIVNLADVPDVRYLKLTVKLEVDSEAVSADLSARVPQVRDAILVLLSSKDVNAVRTTQGKFQLRDEITQRINGLLPKPGVRSAYFTDFVVQ
ncbi:MAG: flagellar basal body-associated FliL family protein [Nitrospira sp.]|nr:flagellar basal body-associated FliL family protein [Nitrospira sp.]MDH4302501.1 flagellar basal body-associated FliL family protein [Nitrospira sp.]MDH5192345.1 flagellar basal body-associated FliL family protein [Nitrospira sp.]